MIRPFTRGTTAGALLYQYQSLLRAPFRVAEKFCTRWGGVLMIVLAVPLDIMSGLAVSNTRVLFDRCPC